MTLDFTLEKYEELLQALEGHRIFTVLSYLEEKPKSDFVILRHDVDRKPMNALRMAELENRRGIKSTYYFRFVKEVFNPEIIKKIYGLGHEIGYHYETLSKTKGDYEEALKVFESQLNEFREICEVKTIAMHGSPLSKYDNRDLWNRYDFKNLSIIGDASISIKGINYFSDTGRTWSLRDNIRDFIQDSSINGYDLNTTNDLSVLAKSKKINCFYISIHPERWAHNNFNWIIGFSRDVLFNFGKSIIKTWNQFNG